jgi:hypothetical protein
MASLISAEEHLRLKVEREILAANVKRDQARIADIDSMLSQPSTSGLQALAESLTWKTNSWGEYTFRTETSGAVIARLAPLVEAVERSPSRRLILGPFEYSVSANPKFLNRKRV